MSAEAWLVVLLPIWPLIPITWFGVYWLRRTAKSDAYKRGLAYFFLGGSYAVVAWCEGYVVGPILTSHHL
jgi:hypothetical protein